MPSASPRLSKTAIRAQAAQIGGNSVTLSMRMDIIKMLSELRSERDQIEQAIVVVERLARGQGKRRGRPPKWMSEMKKDAAPDGEPRKKRVVSAAARKRMAEAQRKRWAAKKQAS